MARRSVLFPILILASVSGAAVWLPPDATASFPEDDLAMRPAIAEVAHQMGDNIDRKVRDFLRVHRKGGQPCPRCGHAISEITARDRITSYCRQCQPEVPQHHLGVGARKAGDPFTVLIASGLKPATTHRPGTKTTTGAHHTRPR